MKPKAQLLGDAWISPVPDKLVEKLETLSEVKKAKPTKARGYDELSLQKLRDVPPSVLIVRWWGSRRGHWYPASEFIIITNYQSLLNGTKESTLPGPGRDSQEEQKRKDFY